MTELGVDANRATEILRVGRYQRRGSFGLGRGLLLGKRLAGAAHL